MDAIANEIQFLSHLAPVWSLLPDRGTFYVHPSLIDHARSRGIEAVPVDRLNINRGGTIKPNRNANRPALVASYGDIKEARRMGYGPLVFLEHGAGQSYRGDSRSPQARNPSYAGGADRDDVGLFLVPNEPCADQWRAAYPAARVEVVGSPRLDGLPRRIPDGQVTVCVSFHWPGHYVSPECGTALGTFAPVLPALAKRFHVIGHAHPKGDWPDRMARVYRQAGIEFVADFDEVCRRADLYVCDNSCVTPDTLVLCADLRWRPAGDIKPGDAIVGCDEEATRPAKLRNGVDVNREDRRFRTAVVEANERKVLPCIEVATDRGTMTVSERHPYLVRRAVPYTYQWAKTGHTYNRTYDQWQWVEARDIKVDDEVAYLGDPWHDATDRDSGWLAGMFDGEGNLNITASKRPGSQHRRIAISVAQNRGPVLDELYRVLDERGMPTVSQSVRGSAKGVNCRKITAGGRLFERLRMLGEIRPMRLLSKALRLEIWDGANVSASVTRARVASVTPVGDREVCVMQTSTKTLIAEGFIAHNSTIPEFASTGRPVVLLNDRTYRKNIEHGGRYWTWSHIGIQVDVPADLGDMIELALEDPPSVAIAREDALNIVYGLRTNGAAAAVTAICDWLASRSAVAA